MVMSVDAQSRDLEKWDTELRIAPGAGARFCRSCRGHPSGAAAANQRRPICLCLPARGCRQLKPLFVSGVTCIPLFQPFRRVPQPRCQPHRFLNTVIGCTTSSLKPYCTQHCYCSPFLSGTSWGTLDNVTMLTIPLQGRDSNNRTIALAGSVVSWTWCARTTAAGPTISPYCLHSLATIRLLPERRRPQVTIAAHTMRGLERLIHYGFGFSRLSI